MNYKELIAKHLASLADRGFTQLEIARMLGFRTGNVISMHMNPTNSITPFPLNRLPALESACGLDALECARLLNARAEHHPESATSMNKATLLWIWQRGVAAAKLLKARRASVGVAHGC